MTQSSLRQLTISVLCTVGVIQSYDPVTGLFTMRQEQAPGSSVSSGSLAEPSDGAAVGAAESGGEAAALAESVEVQKVSQTKGPSSLPLPSSASLSPLSP